MVLSNKSWVLLGFHQRYIEMYWDVTNNVQDNERFNQPKYGTHRPKWEYNEDIATKELLGYGYTPKNSCVSRKGPGDEKDIVRDRRQLSSYSYPYTWAHCNDCNKSNLRLETWAIFVWILISGVVSPARSLWTQSVGWMDIYIYIYIICIYIYRVIRCSSYIRGCKHKSWHHMAPSLSVSETTDAQNLLAISGSPFWES